MSKTICPLPWLHLSVNTDTAVRVCCNTDHSGRVLSENGEPIFLSELKTLDSFYNNEFMRSIRKQMMSGERPQFCKKCYSIEDQGGTSMREIYVNQFEQQMKGILEATEPDGEIVPDIRYIDFSLSNQCNLKCRMCTPGSSYILKKEFDEIGIGYDKDYTERAHRGWGEGVPVDKLIEPHVSNLEEMLTTGGEPFISKPHRAILKKLIELNRAKDIILRYHSNLTLVPEELVTLWRSFKRIDIHVSLEGVGELNEYIRFKSNWSTFKENLAKLIMLKAELPICLEFHSCFQAYNLFGIPELLKFTETYKNHIPAVPHFIWIDYPDVLAAPVLPMSLRLKAIGQISIFLDENESRLTSGPFSGFNAEKINLLRSYLKALAEAPVQSERWQKFLEYSKNLDHGRKIKLGDVVPEFFVDLQKLPTQESASI